MWRLFPLALIMGLCLPFHHREFIGVMTPDYVQGKLLLDTTYKNIFNFSSMLAQRTFRHCQVTETVTAFQCSTCPVKNVYIYGRGTGIRTLTWRIKSPLC